MSRQSVDVPSGGLGRKWRWWWWSRIGGRGHGEKHVVSMPPYKQMEIIPVRGKMLIRRHLGP